MEAYNTEPRLSAYLHSKACLNGTPLAGTFELTPRCNFDCKMCYVHLSEQEQQRRGNELSADQWLKLAEAARSNGMLFMLLTGGEPLIRRDFRFILAELKKMGLLVSVNSNGALIDKDWIDFFRHEPPFRFNITLYGSGNEAYERLCGRAEFDRVLNNIRMLKQLGVDVKINVSLTPYNAGEMRKIYDIANELGTPIQMTTYMFPPIRRDEEMIGRNDRFTPNEAAHYSFEWDKLRFTPKAFAQRTAAIKKGLEMLREDACAGMPGEGIACRAGRSAFWINWQGNMTPCGMMAAPFASALQLGFDEAWRRIKAAAAAIRLPAECAACSCKHICNACAAMCVTETGHFDVRPEYPCQMAHATAALIIKED